MRVSSRFSSNTLLIVIGTSALAVAILILLTGGFRVDAGALHLSLHRWTRPLLVAAIAWALLAWRNPTVSAGILTSVTLSVERYAAAIALVVAIAAAAAGVAFGTYAASGSDAGGYVGEAQLLAAERLHFDEPLAGRVSWPDAVHAFAPLGFRASGPPGRLVPTYPPGLPLAMATASAAAGEIGPFLVSPLLEMVAVLATFAFASALHSRIAGLIAAVLMATSPIALYQASQPMSDTPVTAWWALALCLAWRASTSSAMFAGVAAACALLTRPNLLPLVAPLALIVAWRSRPLPARAMFTRVIAFGSVTAVMTMPLLLLQWRMYGSPLESGYGSSAVADFFAVANIPRNVTDYTHRLLVGESPALVLLLAAGVFIAVAPRRVARCGLTPAITLAALFAATVIACYLPYGVFAEWSYLRFLLPAFPALFAIVGTVAAKAVSRLPRAAAGVAVIAVASAVSVANVAIAGRHLAFEVRDSEARYDFAGRYLNSSLPRNAVVITAQHSASVHDYSGLPIVRWDLLTAPLDAAVGELATMGRRPVIVVEEWERPLLAQRFPASSYARLDWAPRADIGDAVRVYLYDPADRLATETYATDRVH